MSVAVLYMAIGSYVDFWDEFHKSCESKFLPGMDKEYYVFTDKTGVFANNDLGASISVVQVNDLGWPLNTLLRFKYFQLVREKVLKCDYCFFFNANAFVNQVITLEDIIPDEEALVGVLHPGYKGRRRMFLPYERKNKRSMAYVNRLSGFHYYQGCLNGGVSSAYMELVSKCNSWIGSDLKNNYIARAHDESHLNKYFIQNPPYTLPTSYAMPEEWGCGGKIVMRDKSKFSWYKEIKNQPNKKSKFSFLKRIIKKSIMEI